MGEISARNFGLLIAYLIPGFTALCGAGVFSPAVHAWLAGPPGPSVGGFLYVTVGSVAAGMTVSAVRWALVDSLHAVTGLRRPAWDDSKLDVKLPAFEYIVDNHYRYYQFYANSFVALLFSYVAWRVSAAGGTVAARWLDAGVMFVESVFLAGSRDALRNYYRRTSNLLGTKESEESDDQRQSSPDGRGGVDDDEEQ